jgi:hypothetical protein
MREADARLTGEMPGGERPGWTYRGYAWTSVAATIAM